MSDRVMPPGLIPEYMGYIEAAQAGKTIAKSAALGKWLDDNPDAKVEKVDQVSPSEALYGFAAWLTCRDEVIVGGANNNCSPWADAVSDFCKSQEFTEPRDRYSDFLKPYPDSPPPADQPCEHECGCLTFPVIWMRVLTTWRKGQKRYMKTQIMP